MIYHTMSVTELADALSLGAKLAIKKLTADWQTSKEGRFQHMGAQYLLHQYRKLDGDPLLCESQPSGDHTLRAGRIQAYRLTPLGEEVKKEILFLEAT